MKAFVFIESKNQVFMEDINYILFRKAIFSKHQFRSSRLQMFYKKVVLKNFANFTVKHLSYEICEIFKNIIFFTGYLGWPLCQFFLYEYRFFPQVNQAFRKAQNYFHCDLFFFYVSFHPQVRSIVSIWRNSNTF